MFGKAPEKPTDIVQYRQEFVLCVLFPDPRLTVVYCTSECMKVSTCELWRMISEDMIDDHKPEKTN